MESSRGRLRHFSSFPSSVLNSLRPMRGSQVSCCTLLICKSQQKATPDNFGNNFCISSNLVNFVCFTWHSMLSRIAFCYYYFLSILFSSFSSFLLFLKLYSFILTSKIPLICFVWRKKKTTDNKREHNHKQGIKFYTRKLFKILV